MRVRLLTGVAFASVLLAACGGGEATLQPVETDEVDMADGQVFDPEGVSVAVGETVTFVNTSSEPHSVTAYENDIPEGAEYFASGGATSEVEARKDIAGGLIAEGGEFEVTFSEPGTYRYFCIPHEGAGMKGTVVVGD